MRPPFSSLCQTTAVSVATILGTGILGLPVALHASGIRPFLLTFTFNLFAQLGVVIALVELLQRAHVVQEQSDSEEHCQTANNSQFLPLSTVDTSQPKTSSLQRQEQDHAPSLHSLSNLFLSKPSLRAFFNAIVIIHFLFIISAYALAGPQALAALTPVLHQLPQWLLPTLFVIFGAIAVIFLEHALLPPLTFGTILKAVLLTAVVFIVLARGLVIRQNAVNDWHPHVLIDPFLMGTFALSGVINLMPVTFQACLEGTRGIDGIIPPMDRVFIRSYRMATVIAILICYILNIIWSIAVLLCVPQTSDSVGATASASTEDDTRFASTLLSQTIETFRQTQSNSSLTEASELGEISTIPLIGVLKARGDSLDWVVVLLVNIFTALSITISFLVMSLGMKHFIDGEARDQSTPDSRFGYDTNRRFKYVLYFAIVLATAVSSPTALFKIMEGVTGLSVNIEAGLFVLYMAYVSRKMTNEIPAPLSSAHFIGLLLFVGSYFSTAILVDVLFYLPHVFR